MKLTLLLPKTAVTTFLLVSLAYGSVHAQSQANTPVPALAPPTTSQNSENAVVLLTRVETIVDSVMGGDKPKKKVVKNDGAVMVSRADLDEILAVVGQLKTLLQSYKPVQSVTAITPTN